ncbi:MAG: imidazole glycerol phosphate synthase subunit HisH [Armatimonadetes bacterium]|nr:imidazole glycerol phosphate synthase subunit HisH [Armatimonadota bacterium]
MDTLTKTSAVDWPSTTNKIAVVDFGLGNMRSLEKALEHLGHHGVTTSDIDVIAEADKIILPGDGAFGTAMRNLTGPDDRGRTLAGAVTDAVRAGKLLFGICVGMQVLLDQSEEFGLHRGIGLIPGEVRRFPERPGVKIPQIGWNHLSFTQPDCPLFRGLTSGCMVYFIHSYYCAPSDPADAAATTTHGIEYCSILHRENVYATQFHPEKSGEVGLTMLKNFAEL